MQNKVVHTLARAMQELGVPTVRFNFRGVGGSAGAYESGGAGAELEDALAACTWARQRWNCESLWLAGFSFGSAVALHAAGVVRARALVTVAPPVGRIIVTPVARPACPWLVVQGDQDELVDVRLVRKWVGDFAPPPRLIVLPGAEHFFHGRSASCAQPCSRSWRKRRRGRPRAWPASGGRKALVLQGNPGRRCTARQETAAAQFTKPFRFLRGMTRTFLLAGLALKTIFSR